MTIKNLIIHLAKMVRCVLFHPVHENYYCSGTSNHKKESACDKCKL